MSAFSAAVLDRAMDTRHTGPLAGATHTGVAGAPGDGPYMELWFEVSDRVIKRAAFRTYGCPAAMACGSMTAQLATGRTVEQMMRLTPRDITLLLGGLPEGKEHCPEMAVQALRRAFERPEADSAAMEVLSAPGTIGASGSRAGEG